MSGQTQYNNVLGQIISLFDEALTRHFCQKQVDVQKFFINFYRMFKRMIRIEQKYQFIQKNKLSCFIKKLPQLSNQIYEQKNNQSSQKFRKSSISPRNLSRYQHSNPSKSLTNRNEQPKQKQSQYNIDYQSNNKFVIQFQSGRPKTSISRIKNQSAIIYQSKQFRRSPNLGYYTQQNRSVPSKKTVSFSQSKPNTGFVTEQELRKNNLITKKQGLKIYQFQAELTRKPFYNQLEHSSNLDQLGQMKVKLPSKKKINSQRWSYKVNKLF